MKEKTIDKLYEFLKIFIKKNGYPPSIREICGYMSFTSTSSAVYYLKKLENSGKITRDSKRNRAIEIPELKEKINFSSIPLLGEIAAGNPILATENHILDFHINDGFFNGTDLFLLQIKGDSMVNAGIYDGDMVVVNKQESAENGQIVAAMIDGRATVKKFFKELNFIKLMPENDNMTPIYSRDVIILGKVVGLIRKIK